MIANNSRGVWEKYRSLPRNQTLIFWIAVASLAATIGLPFLSFEKSNPSAGFLQLQEILVKPPAFCEGQPLVVRIIMRNKGNAPVFKVRYYAYVGVADHITPGVDVTRMTKEKFLSALSDDKQRAYSTHNEVGVDGLNSQRRNPGTD